MVVDEGIWPSNHETRLTSNENKADKNKWCFRLLKQKLIQVLLVGVLKDINPLESHPNISKLRQPDNLERSSFKAKHSNMIAPLSRFQDVVWLHIHIYKYNVYIYIYISCIYPFTHLNNQEIPHLSAWNILKYQAVIPHIHLGLHSPGHLPAWQQAGQLAGPNFIHSPTNKTTNNSAPKVRKISFSQHFPVVLAISSKIFQVSPVGTRSSS